MNSAFGIDHGEISKGERDRRAGAKQGALIGLGATGISQGMRSGQYVRYANAAKEVGHSKGKIGTTIAGMSAANAALDVGFGAGVGAAIGTKKKRV